MINPLAGEAMAFIWVVVRRGTNTPLVEAVTSSMAEALGVSVPIPTLLFCPRLKWGNINIQAENPAAINIFLIM
jgi:hypothetical protein